MGTYMEHHYPEKLRDLNADQYRQLISEVEHLHKRCGDLVKENDDLKQKSQVVVKKVKTNIVETKPGLEKEVVEKIHDLESRLDQAEYEVEVRVKEIAELQKIVIRIHDVESRLDQVETENVKLNAQLSQSLVQLEALNRQNSQLEDLNQKNISIISERNKEVENLCKRLQELELLPNHLSKAKKDLEILSVETDRLAVLLKGRDREIERLNSTIEQLKTERCVHPEEHEELKIKFKEIVDLKKTIASFSALKDTLNQLEDENKRIKSNLREFEELNRQLKTKIEDITKDVFKLKEELKLRDITIAEMEREKNKLILEIERVKVE